MVLYDTNLCCNDFIPGYVFKVTFEVSSYVKEVIIFTLLKIVDEVFEIKIHLDVKYTWTNALQKIITQSLENESLSRGAAFLMNRVCYRTAS